MGTDLGALLVDCSLVPVRVAACHFGAQRVVEGLEVLAPDRLRRALHRGVAAEAARAGVDVQTILDELPWEEVEATLDRFGRSRAEAIDVWKQHRMESGGFLAGVVDVTTLDPAPDVGWFLARLATKVTRDGHLSGPVEMVASEIAHWEQLVTRCGSQLSESPKLARAYGHRRMRGALVYAAFGVVLGCAAWAGMSIAASRERVAAALASGDPCATLAIAPVDLARGSEEQRATASARLARCTEARSHEQHRKDGERVRETREDRCAALATAIETGDASAETIAAASSDKADLLGRVARGALDAQDFAETRLVCEDTAAGTRLWRSMARAAAGSPRAWEQVDRLSDRLRALLVTAFPLQPESRAVLGKRAEATAQRAVRSGDAASLASAGSLCGLEVELGVELHMWCKGALAVLAKR